MGVVFKKQGVEFGIGGVVCDYAAARVYENGSETVAETVIVVY